MSGYIKLGVDQRPAGGFMRRTTWDWAHRRLAIRRCPWTWKVILWV